MEKDISKWTKPQLQSHLRKLGLKVSGNKPELIQRIRDYKEPKQTRSPKRNQSPQRILAGAPELNFQIFLNMDDRSLANICKSSKEAANICKDDIFWKKRIIHVFGHNLSKYKVKKLTYRDMYKFFKKYEDYYSERMILESIKLGHLPVLKYLLKEIELEYPINNALYIAISAGKLDIVKYLLEQGANVNVYIGSYTPFIMAVRAGKLNIVKYIINNIKLEEYSLENALISANDGKNLQMIKLLVEAGASDLNDSLVIAMFDGSYKIVDYLVKKGANIEVAIEFGEISHNVDNRMLKYLKQLRR